MKSFTWSRALVLVLAVAAVCLMQGDSALSQAVTTDVGMDPLSILDLQVKPNVLIVLDTSGSMRFPPNTAINGPTADLNVGGDDPIAKMYQAKDALNQVLSQNAGKFNFGFASYGVLNSGKELVEPSFTDTNGNVGPLTYVSIDANADRWTGGGSGANGQGSVADYFTSGNTGAYLGTTATRVFNSFRPFNQVYPGPGCATGTNCRYYLFSRILRNNLVFRFNTGSTTGLQSGYPASFTCPLPPVGLFPGDPNTDSDPTQTDIPRPCFRLETTASGNPGAVFYYSSGTWEMSNLNTSCSSSALLANVAACASDNTDAIKTHLRLEMPVDGTCGDTVGIPCKLGTGNWVNNTTTSFDGTNPAAAQGFDPNTVYGIQAAQATPLAGVLRDARTNFNTFFPNVVTGQRNFVLMVTDGDDTCANNPTTDPPAQALTNYNNSPRIETLVIGFGLNSTVLNAIARNGSGGTLDAFTASNTQELVDKLNQALQQTTVTGEFSDTQTVTESVFEFGATAGIDPRDPDVRYTKSVPLLMQSTFEMPGFVGHLNAFRNNGGASLQVWDAGDKLCQRLTGFPATTVPPAHCNVPTGAAGVHATLMGNQSFNFVALMGTTATAANNYVQTDGRLRRRIFTTTRNGVFPYAYTSANIKGATQVPSDGGPTVALWPPSTTNPGADPAQSGQSYPAGLLDGALGIASMDFATLQNTFGACKRSGTDALPANCGNTTRQLALAMKEAREMILAFTAGAQVVRDNLGNPRRDTNGLILYKARTWFLADGTLSGPALTAQPLQSPPGMGIPEYTLYRDGPRAANGTPMAAPTNQSTLGFGLRNPDTDSNTATKATSKADLNLKPVMSVVYYGANDMLHAFRGGPQCAVIGSTTSCPGNADTGGEELWGFVPFDQLGKQQQIMLQGQSRSNHKYIIATAIRFGDIFVPGAFTDPSNVSRTGRWRRLLFFGRGIGGRYYTALDVTNPGPFTWCALPMPSQTCPAPSDTKGTNPPLVLWSRGNPDTQDGTATGTANSATNSPRAQLGSASNLPIDQGVTDATAYATMGQSWSVPALARVNPANNFNHDFVIYSGSGYRTANAGEGRSFYSVDPITGDILTQADVGSGSSSVIADNVIVANPAVFNRLQLSAPGVANVGNPATVPATRVYVGDLHGRLWKFLTDSPGTAVRVQDFGVSQPIANAVGLINFDGGTGEKPHIFVEMGNDRRIPPPPTLPPPPIFKLVGLEDNGSDTDTNADNATVLFSFDLPDRYRGTVQPATAFSTSGNARVFMVGTRFNPVSVTGTCNSSFDSILYAISGQTGTAAYDLNQSGAVDSSDISTTLTNSRVNAVSVSYGQVTVDQGLQAQNPPPPPAPPPIAPSTTSQQVFVLSVYAGGSPVCR